MTKEYVGDAKLVERFQNGDIDAFNEIDRFYRPRLIRFIFRRLQSKDLAEEIAQETLTRAFATLHGLQGRDFLSPWLYRIAYNYCVDWQRRNWDPTRRTISYDESDMSKRGADLGEHDSWFTGNEKRLNGNRFYNETVEGKAVRSEEYKNIWRVALEVLTREEYLILWMKYVEEADDEEISQRTGKRVGTLRVSLSRIKKKLINYLKQ